MNKLQSKLAAFGGDLWCSWRLTALWPFPAIILGNVEPLFTEEDYRVFCHHLLPGDFILTKSQNHFASNLAISGTAFKHLAVYVGPVSGTRTEETFIKNVKSLDFNNQEKNTKFLPRHAHKRTVCHAISEGVVCQDIMKVLMHADYACIIRPWVTQEEQIGIVHEAIACLGLEYNFDFTPEGPKALYCTELGAHCLMEMGLQPPNPRPHTVSLLGRQYPVFMTDDFIKFPMLACSRSCTNKKFLESSELGKAFENAIYSCLEKES